MTGWNDQLEGLATFLGRPGGQIVSMMEDLGRSGLLSELHTRAAALSEFRDADLTKAESFSLYRTMLYVLIRLERPSVVIETGVLNGFSSAFMLQALEANGIGRLVSIDLPSRGLGLDYEGTKDLPASQSVGWAIPDRLKARHDLRLGESELLLPDLLATGVRPDLFLHDSLHAYNHMMMELTLAKAFAEPGTVIVADNVELNEAFADFCEGNGMSSIILESYDRPDRIWRHGVTRA